MSLTPQFTNQMISNVMNAFLEKTDEEIIATLYYIGEDVVNKCKINGNYGERSGNLRSSIGCAVMKGGSIIWMVAYGSNPIGVQKGEDFADEIKSQFPQGYCLLIWAGMHYAIYVESMDAYSVLSSWLPDTENFANMLKELL